MPVILAPSILVLICWGLSFGLTAMAVAFPQVFDLVPVFLRREGRDLGDVAQLSIGHLWLVTALLAFLVGCLAGNVATRHRPPGPFSTDLVRAARIVARVNLLLLLVTGAWIAVSAAKVGGLVPLILLSVADNLIARDTLLDTKLFTGMRLFYAALPATGCLAAGLLATGLPPRAKRACIGVLVLNTVTLALLPIVMSQRLLLLQFLLSSYMATCLVKRRIVGLRWLLLAGLLFLGVWMLRESVTNPQFYRHPVDLGLQKLAYYFVNDLGNAIGPVGADIPHTYGAVSFRGVLFLTFSEGLIEGALKDRLAMLNTLKGGGEFPLLTAPFVDFGVAGGVGVLMLFGFVCQVIYRVAHVRFLAAVVYAQIGAGLLFSSHAVYISHQNQLFGLILIFAIARLSRVTAMPPAPIRLSDPAKDAVFHTRRKRVEASETARPTLELVCA